MPPTAGEATTSIGPKASRALSASARQSRSVRRRILEHEHLLQEDRRMQARRQDEMAFQQSAGGAKLVKRLIGG